MTDVIKLRALVYLLSCLLGPTLWDPIAYSPPGSSVHEDSPGKNTGAGCHAQGIFPAQVLNPGLLHCRWVLYQLNYQGSPKILHTATKIKDPVTKAWHSQINK